MYETQAILSWTIFKPAVKTLARTEYLRSKGILQGCRSSITKEQPRFC